MEAFFFLIMTTCTVNPGALADNCHDYILDGGLTYSDCQKAAAMQPWRADLFSLRCDRGEKAEGK